MEGDNNAINTKEIAEKWGISSRRVTFLCKEGRGEGAVFKGIMWLIHGDVQKPSEQKLGRKRKKVR
jgi:hypothetical protein